MASKKISWEGLVEHLIKVAIHGELGKYPGVVIVKGPSKLDMMCALFDTQNRKRGSRVDFEMEILGEHISFSLKLNSTTRIDEGNDDWILRGEFGDQELESEFRHQFYPTILCVPETSQEFVGLDANFVRILFNAKSRRGKLFLET